MLGADSPRDIQIRCPMNRGSVGVSALNRRLQEILNPRGIAVTCFGRTFHFSERLAVLEDNLRALVIAVRNRKAAERHTSSHQRLQARDPEVTWRLV